MLYQFFDLLIHVIHLTIQRREIVHFKNNLFLKLFFLQVIYYFFFLNDFNNCRNFSISFEKSVLLTILILFQDYNIFGGNSSIHTKLDNQIDYIVPKLWQCPQNVFGNIVVPDQWIVPHRDILLVV